MNDGYSFFTARLSPGPGARIRGDEQGRSSAEEKPRVDGGLLTACDVAELLQVPRSWVYAEARAGRIPHVAIGRYRRFRPAAIETWVQGLERGPVAGAAEQ